MRLAVSVCCGLLESLLEVVDDVVDVLNAYGQADEVGGDTCLT